MKFRWQSSFLSAIAFVLVGCDSTPNSSGAAPNVGIAAIPPLTAEAATNQLQLLERIRHLPKTAAFEKRTFARTRAPQQQLKYLLFKPKGFDAQRSYPLVLSLHGGAPRHRFEDLVEPYLPGLAYGLGRFVSDDTQDTHPCFLLAPWSDNSDWNTEKLTLVIELIDALQKEFQIDSKRIYVTGQSMGGFGTWSIITQYPGRFAAAVPICGGGELSEAAKAKDIPIWAFHGTADKVVSVDYTRRMIAALYAAGAKPLYWEYQGADHSGTAERAYCEPELVSWMFDKSKP
jgi:predicted peptidase